MVFSEAAFLPQRADVSLISMEGDHLRTPLLQESYTEAHAKISPDGRWVAYTSTESGKNEIYVRPFPEVNNGKWLISTGNGVGPLWARDGRRIFYRSDDAVMEVGVETEPAFKFEKPKVLFRGNYFYMKAGQAVEPAWDISPDSRFMMIKEVQPTEKDAASQAPLRLNVVINWFEELKQRVPTGK